MSSVTIDEKTKLEIGVSESAGVGRLDETFDCFGGDTLCDAIERADCEKRRYFIRQLTAEELRELEYRCREKVLQIETDLKTIRLHNTKSAEKEKNTEAALERFQATLEYIREQRRRVNGTSPQSEDETARLFLEEAMERLSEHEFGSILMAAIEKQYDKAE